VEEKKPRHAKQPSDDLSIPVAPKKEEKKAKMKKKKPQLQAIART